MSFAANGSFANANNRLACFETSHGSTESNKGRTAKRKIEITEKADDQLDDNSNPRGYIIEQMLRMEFSTIAAVGT